MNMKRKNHSLSLFLCIMLIVAMALFTSGCNDNKKQEESLPTETVKEEATEKEVLGQGNTVFDFTVVDLDQNETQYEIHTDKKTVGEALEELELIEGEEGPYGLYVKTVNGITLDFDKDGKYWAFYVNDEYGQTGADVTEIQEGTSYAFKAE